MQESEQVGLFAADDLPAIAAGPEIAQTIYVHFEDAESVAEFGKLIGLPITTETRFLRFPLPDLGLTSREGAARIADETLSIEEASRLGLGREARVAIVDDPDVILRSDAAIAHATLSGALESGVESVSFIGSEDAPEDGPVEEIVAGPIDHAMTVDDLIARLSALPPELRRRRVVRWTCDDREVEAWQTVRDVVVEEDGSDVVVLR